MKLPALAPALLKKELFPLWISPTPINRPLRGELYNLEQLADYAKRFAARQLTIDQKGSASLLRRLDENEEVLKSHYRDTQALDPAQRATPASEWLLDNFYLIEEQIQMARRHLPRGYSRELPCGPNGYPRVYDIALELITHVDAQIEAESLSVFLEAYQTVTPLKIGELWAIPIMFRLGLIENLRRIALHLDSVQRDHDIADYWMRELQVVTEESPSQIVIVMGEMAKSNLPVSSSFVAEFSQALSRQGPILHWARSWFEQLLAEKGLSVEPLVHEENQNQAAEQVSVSHSITSLRFLGAMDWKEFVESMSVVDQCLRLDPADVYSDMDFQSRDSYRHAIERVAKYGRYSEPDVARMAVDLAAANAKTKGRGDRRSHVGYFLVDEGLIQLESDASVRHSLRNVFEEKIRRAPTVWFIGGVSLLTLLFTALVSLGFLEFGVSGWPLALLLIPALIVCSQLALGLINWLSILFVHARLLPRLDFLEGIPSDTRTMVVVPAMLSGFGTIDQLVENLELHYLGNNDPHVTFSLLTDFCDAPQEIMPQDQALLEKARTGIEGLNQKYGDGSTGPFHLFHRPRLWNPQEKCWMGYERKRGKISQFNNLMRGKGRENFSEVIGNASIFPSVKYVVTLDADTQLPRDTIKQLAGTMAHPLNRAVLDDEHKVVRAGYGILQPRVQLSLTGANLSLFVKLWAGEVGVDPYTRASSNVYQDLFSEGSFIGKGIYDLDAFEQSTGTRFPDNTILSHDLIESGYARSGLVSDVVLYEDHPARYQADVRRRHRWVRGDWQIAPWLWSRVPACDESCVANKLSRLAQWKIFDNLRRSLVSMAVLVLLIISWLVYPQTSLLVAGLIAAMVLVPGVLGWLTGLIRIPQELPLMLHLRESGTKGLRLIGQALFDFVFIPYEAWMHLDAMIRTVWRLSISRRHLLEWQTAKDTERLVRSDLLSSCLPMWQVEVMVLAVTGVLFYQGGLSWSSGLFLSLWFISPVLSWIISRPFAPRASEISPEQTVFLRKVARRTWRFFEVFVNDQENWLPPDNFQEVPFPVIASRTSPTNIGLCLLANLTAYDFGYIPVGEVIRRSRLTIETMEKMEKYRGHLYNWYDTRSLKPLRPLYVSSVDSGNLAGHLLTMEPGLHDLANRPVYSSAFLTGMRDCTGILLELGCEHSGLKKLHEKLSKIPETLSAGYAALKQAEELARDLEKALQGDNEEIRWWAQSLHHGCRDHIQDLLYVAPWLAWEPAISRVGLSGGLETRLSHLDKNPTLREISELGLSLVPSLEEQLSSEEGQSSRQPSERDWLEKLKNHATQAGEQAGQRILELESLARECRELANMDFTFLFDKERSLFSIGYNVDDFRRDTSYYDLLASEARLCSYVVIAQGQIHQSHWFSLGRLLLASGSGPVLASWSGSMFEYLMPMLVMPTYEGTLLDQTCKGAVEKQIDYGHSQNVPWGISESGYNRTDASMNYQYRAFGVPGLGLKRGLSEDLVIAPYAAVMALMVAPGKACKNLERLFAEGKSGAYGFYEAVDYTASRLPRDKNEEIIYSFMAHHQGMSFLSLDYALLGQPMQKRFMSSPSFKATALLLQERAPNTSADVFHEDMSSDKSRRPALENEGGMRIYPSARLPTPEVHLMSNGRYNTMVSTSGGGYSRWKDLALTRWHQDATCDSWGNFVYIRDTGTGEYWSASYQPVLRDSKSCEAIFSQGRAEFRQHHDNLEVHTEICVSPEDDVEIRRLTLVNRSNQVRRIELTSYAEVVLAPAAADLAHPAFSNLFVQTEFDPARRAILCTRRARSVHENPPWLLHLVVPEASGQAVVSCETDRNRFIGRGYNRQHPQALRSAPGPLSGTTGSVLDPVISLRYNVTIKPQGSVRLDYILGVSETREGAMDLVNKYNNPRMSDRVLDLAWTHSQVTLRHLNILEKEAQLYSRLAGNIIYANPSLRSVSSVLLNNRHNQSALWGHGLSGDVPIVLLRISDISRLGLVRELVQAHAYWKGKGLTVDLVILSKDDSTYRQPLQEEIIRMVGAGTEGQMMDKTGGIFIRYEDQIPDEAVLLLQAVAHVTLRDENGTLEEQMERPPAPDSQVPALVPVREHRREVGESAWRELIFHNGYGGFTKDGKEYVINLQPGRMTPAPWINVLANPYFGTIVSESGGSYTWLENCHEFRLTPWNNDSVSDSSGEAFYIRDEDSGQYWSPSPLPARGAGSYTVRHGFGYTVFEHSENGISTELWIYVATDAPVKFATLKVRNTTKESRRISVTGYWEWVLAELRSKSLLHVQTQLDPRSGALLARNPFNIDFGDRIAFIDVNDSARSLTGDRREFIGRNGNMASPSAMKKQRLSGKVGAGFDPCGAVQVPFDLPPHGEKEICFRVGVGRSTTEVQTLIQRFRRPNAPRAALEAVWAYWNRSLGAVTVETPDPAVNVMVNGWLQYQTQACRIWARSGFYQSGGAFGFRDQLQDVMALVHTEPVLMREHLLRAAAQQFREGDVLHWWHPPSGRGVRTRFSDDYLWLPYAVCRYVNCLADTGVLDELVPFLEGRPLRADEESNYDLPNRAGEARSLYEHCVRAIQYGLKFGEHGLPLIGCGDWNDGMNLVGEKGKGESVWLAFFLYDVLTRFSKLAQLKNDPAFAEICIQQAEQLKKNIESQAWDGEWYRRAYFDDGTPLGSKENAECQIDSLPQSWAIISQAGDPERSRQAMSAVRDRLVKKEAGLIQLFDPPFDKSDLNPGYIKGYIPGVRENGGQYTHSAIWATMAFAMMGNHDEAWELFRMLNPVMHGDTAEHIETYKVEPYVVAADVYAVAPHIGRGGWTWYTGSSGWMYRLVTETLLGIHLEGDHLRIAPRLPGEWSGFKVRYRYRNTFYYIAVIKDGSQPAGSLRVMMDGKNVEGQRVPLTDNRQDHHVEIRASSF